MKNGFVGKTISIGVLATLAAIAIGFAGISAAAAQTLYTVTDLGEVPGHYTGCFAIQLNDRADVVGTCSSEASGRTARTEAVVWRNGTLNGLGVLTGGHSSEAHAINSLGVTTGTGDTGDGRPQGWVTTTTAGVLLNIFPNSGNTRPLFIGDSGWIGGYYIKSAARVSKAPSGRPMRKTRSSTAPRTCPSCRVSTPSSRLRFPKPSINPGRLPVGRPMT